MRLYCLDAQQALPAQSQALALGVSFQAAWPEAPLSEREFAQFRRQIFAGLMSVLSAADSTSDQAAVLIYDGDGLALQTLDKPLPGPVRVDFADTALQRRTRNGQAHGESVARACGVRKGATPRVLDATAGLGRDSWILASLGASVEMLERAPVVHALLADGLRRAHLDPELLATAQRMSLLADSAHQVLMSKLHLPAEARPEVVYLDPMFPHRDKSAKVKKDMWAFRHLVGSDSDADALLDMARAVASKRVVVKRPRIAPDLNNEPPHQRLLGQSSRFDLYTPKPLS